MDAKSENKIQWIVIFLTVFGMLFSTYYNNKMLRATRLQSELASYLNLTDRYHNLVFELIRNDHDVFQKSDSASLGQNKHLLYELIELFSTIDRVEQYHIELGKGLWPVWKERLEFLGTKPAIQFAWEKRRQYEGAFCSPQFYAFMDQVTGISNPPISLSNDVMVAKAEFEGETVGSVTP